MNRVDLEPLTIAALDAAWSQHQVVARRQATQFAYDLQSLHFAKSNVCPGGAPDALLAFLMPALR